MEKHKHVFERFATFDNMYNGYLLARQNKRYKKEVLVYSANLEENLIEEEIIEKLNTCQSIEEFRGNLVSENIKMDYICNN